MVSKFTAKTWFITGATGLVGSTIIEILRENDLPVIGLVRAHSPQHMIEFLQEMDVQIVVGDLLEPSSYEKYLPTCDLVVHTAAAVQVKDKEINWEVNYTGTKLLCEKMKEYGLDRLVHISTAGVYGVPYTHKVKEDTEPNPYGPYLKSKYAAEQLITNEFPDLSITIIRPPFIFGDPTRDRHVYKTLIDNIPNIIPRVWRFNPKLGFAHAEDIARMVLQVGSTASTPSLTYNIQSFEIKLNQILNMVKETRENKTRIIPVPYTIWYLIALIGDIINKIRGEPFGYRQRLTIVKKNWTFSIDKARRELGFEPNHIEPNELERMLRAHYISLHPNNSDKVDLTKFIGQQE